MKKMWKSVKTALMIIFYYMLSFAYISLCICGILYEQTIMKNLFLYCTIINLVFVIIFFLLVLIVLFNYTHEQHEKLQYEGGIKTSAIFTSWYRVITYFLLSTFTAAFSYWGTSIMLILCFIVSVGILFELTIVRMLAKKIEKDIQEEEKISDDTFKRVAKELTRIEKEYPKDRPEMKKSIEKMAKDIVETMK